MPLRTIAHHIKEPWAWTPSASRYFFCEDPNCEAVYFGDDGSLISKRQPRTLVGIKEEPGRGLVCYCFGVSKDNFPNDPANWTTLIPKQHAVIRDAFPAYNR